MSGHSKWHSIKHKKGAADAKRGKVFTRHASLITIAAREGGGDIDMNPTLRLAIENAKKDNVPNANIDRSIKRGSGEGKDAVEIHEVRYEGYGPSGTAIIIDCITDNKNRTYTSIRTIFGKRGGNLGASGCVTWMFDRFGVIVFDLEKVNVDELELAAIDSGAEDIKNEDGMMEIYTQPKDLTNVVSKLKEAGFEPEKAEVSLVPNNSVKIEDADSAQKVFEFIDAIEEDEDVINVSSNFDVSDEIMEQLS